MNHPRYNYLYAMSQNPLPSPYQKSENDKRRMFDNTINSVINENIQSQIIHENKQRTDTKNEDTQRTDTKNEDNMIETYVPTQEVSYRMSPFINFEVSIQTIIIIMLFLFCFMFYIICKMNSKINQLCDIINHQNV